MSFSMVNTAIVVSCGLAMLTGFLDTSFVTTVQYESGSERKVRIPLWPLFALACGFFIVLGFVMFFQEVGCC